MTVSITNNFHSPAMPSRTQSSVTPNLLDFSLLHLEIRLPNPSSSSANSISGNSSSSWTSGPLYCVIKVDPPANSVTSTAGDRTNVKKTPISKKGKSPKTPAAADTEVDYHCIHSHTLSPRVAEI